MCVSELVNILMSRCSIAEIPPNISQLSIPSQLQVQITGYIQSPPEETTIKGLRSLRTLVCANNRLVVGQGQSVMCHFFFSDWNYKVMLLFIVVRVFYWLFIHILSPLLFSRLIFRIVTVKLKCCYMTIHQYSCSCIFVNQIHGHNCLYWVNEEHIPSRPDSEWFDMV